MTFIERTMFQLAKRASMRGRLGERASEWKETHELNEHSGRKTTTMFIERKNEKDR